MILAASAVSLSYFSVFGLVGGSKYTGLALDNNSIILVFIFLFESAFSQGAFSIILYVSGLGLAALNISQIKIPELTGNPINVYIIAIYTFGMTTVYGNFYRRRQIWVQV